MDNDVYFAQKQHAGFKSAPGKTSILLGKKVLTKRIRDSRSKQFMVMQGKFYYYSVNEHNNIWTAKRDCRAGSANVVYNNVIYRLGQDSKIFCRGLKNGPRPKAEGRF